MTTRALLHSLLVCHLPLSTTWLVCFLSLIYFFLHGTSFKKQKKKTNIGVVSCYFAHTNTNTRIVQITLIKELMLGEGNITSTLHYTHMGVTSFGQSSLKWFWWCRYVKHDATLCAMQQILMGCSDIVKALAELSLSFREVFKDVKSTPVVLTALQFTHKRGGKTNHVPAEHGSVCFPWLSA